VKAAQLSGADSAHPDILKVSMRVQAIFVCLVGAIAFGQVASNQTAPKTMTKLVVHLQSQDVPQASFAAQPKTMYRAGTRYCRIEELPDAEHGIHGLVVINEPDIWLVNLLAKTAQHQLDLGTTSNCRLPVFVTGEYVKSGADTHSQLMEPEFGRELAYFEEKEATSGPGPVLQGKATKAYTVGIGDVQLVLFTTGTPERPVAMTKQQGNKREVYWYGTYEEIPFDPKLFAKPEGVKIEDAK
jgi:hypothetical protein